MKIHQVNPKRYAGRPVVVLPDVHIEYVDKKAWSSVLKYIRDVKPAAIIQLGDFLDLNCLSSHNKGKPKLVEGERLAACYKTGYDALKTLRHAVGLKCDIFYIQGNHEQRVTRYIEMFPYLEGSLDIANGLKLDELGITWIPFWDKGDILKVGKATFIHGRYTGQYHAKKHVDIYGCNIFYGHVHDIMCYPKTFVGRNTTLTGQSLGWLGGNLPYMKGQPENWQHAFATFHFRPDGYFHYYVSEIYNGKFIGPNGKQYSG